MTLFACGGCGGCKQLLKGSPSHAKFDILCLRNRSLAMFFHAMGYSHWQFFQNMTERFQEIFFSRLDLIFINVEILFEQWQISASEIQIG